MSSLSYPPQNAWQLFQADRLRLASLVLALIGLADSAYLSYTKLVNTSIYCGPGSTACDAVSNSIFGQVMGIPVAYLGLAAYLALIALLALETRGEFWAANGPILIFGLTLFGTLFSLYLQYTSLFILREVCPYCVISAGVQIALFVIAIVRLRRALTVPA